MKKLKIDIPLYIMQSKENHQHSIQIKHSIQINESTYCEYGN